MSDQSQPHIQQDWPLPPAAHEGNDGSGRLSLEELEDLFVEADTVTNQDPLPSSHTTVPATPPNPIDQFAHELAWMVADYHIPGAFQSSLHQILGNPTDADRARMLVLLQQMGIGMGLLELSILSRRYRLRAGKDENPGGK